MTNEYSQTWLETFCRAIPLSQTENEVAFLQRQLPQSTYHRILDLCCGEGRHASLLADKGYQVVGVDCLETALDRARRFSKDKVTYVLEDMRKVSSLPGTFDAVINLWNSFGYFDEMTNTDILKQLSDKLSSKGRLILDIYHKGFFEEHPGEYRMEKDARTIIETKYVKGNRLTLQLDYGPKYTPDSFDWEVFTPAEICKRVAQFRLKPVVMCSCFDEQKPADITIPRMQLVFEKVE